MSLFISKAVSQFILPPGGLILLAMLGLICWKKWYGRMLVLLSLLLLWALSSEPVRDVLLSPLEHQYPAFAPAQYSKEHITPQYSAIVLLGCGINASSPEYAGADALSRHALKRTVYAAFLAKQTGLKVYATGGRSWSDTGASEAELMKQMLMQLGVEASRIETESQARNTWENAANLRRMMLQTGIRHVILVTTAWHIPRSVWVFETQGFSVRPAPCDFVVEAKAYDIRSYLPHWQVLADSSNALHEYLGLLWYNIRYQN